MPARARRVLCSRSHCACRSSPSPSDLPSPYSVPDSSGAGGSSPESKSWQVYLRALNELRIWLSLRCSRRILARRCSALRFDSVDRALPGFYPVGGGDMLRYGLVLGVRPLSRLPCLLGCAPSCVPRDLTLSLPLSRLGLRSLRFAAAALALSIARASSRLVTSTW